MRPLALDLFSGAGGATVGLLNAGFEVVGFECWEYALETHRLNSFPCIVAALTSSTDFSEVTGVDMIWGSPPCQPFSVTGKSGGSNDQRDGTPAFLHAVSQVMPRLVVMENVAGLRLRRHRTHLDQTVDALRAFGYYADWKVLNAADYGLPQRRKRLFLIGRLDGEPNWPIQTHSEEQSLLYSPWVTMAEALSWDADTCRERAVHGPDDTECFWPLEGPSATVVGSFRPDKMAPPVYRKSGPRQNARGTVYITEREGATLQGFPDDHEFGGYKTHRWQQIGNAVPPLLAELLVRSNSE